MHLRPRKNRRRVDLQRRTGELKAAARTHGPTALKVLGLLAASLALTWGAVEAWGWATTTPAFALQTVAVTGEARATEAELLKLGPIVPGSNLVALDVAAIERSLGTHPWVKRVAVRRALPHRLDVQVQEHEPVALLSLGDLYLVNRDGEPFKRARPGEALDLPLVSGIDRERFTGEGRPQALQAMARALAAAEAFARAFPGRGQGLSEVLVEDDGLTLVTARGEEVRLGAGELEPALVRLQKVRSVLEARRLQAEVIRLDNRVRPDRVTVQLTGGGPREGRPADSTARP